MKNDVLSHLPEMRFAMNAKQRSTKRTAPKKGAKKTNKKGKRNPTGINLLVCQVVKAAIGETLQRARSNIRRERRAG